MVRRGPLPRAQSRMKKGGKAEEYPALSLVADECGMGSATEKWPQPNHLRVCSLCTSRQGSSLQGERPCLALVGKDRKVQSSPLK